MYLSFNVCTERCCVLVPPGGIMDWIKTANHSLSNSTHLQPFDQKHSTTQNVMDESRNLVTLHCMQPKKVNALVCWTTQASIMERNATLKLWPCSWSPWPMTFKPLPWWSWPPFSDGDLDLWPWWPWPSWPQWPWPSIFTWTLTFISTAKPFSRFDHELCPMTLTFKPIPAKVEFLLLWCRSLMSIRIAMTAPLAMLCWALVQGYINRSQTILHLHLVWISTIKLWILNTVLFSLATAALRDTLN